MGNIDYVLPIVYPPVDAYPHQGALFSMLFAREECKPWIFNNFIQTYSLKDLYKSGIRSGTIDFFYNQYGDWKHFEFKANPWIKFNSIPVEMINKLNIDFIEFVKMCIHNNKYMFFSIDRYYIPAYKQCYMKEHLDHDIFIYGYNDKEQQFYMGDNTDWKYCQTTVKYEELSKSFYSLLDMYQEDSEKYYYSEKSIFLFEIKKNTEVSAKDPLFIQEVYSINIKKIINDIKEYLLFENYGGDYNKSEFYVYGTQCYDELVKLINYTMEDSKLIDARAFYSFLQHKKLMLLRLKYLNSNDMINKITDEYSQLVNDFNRSINLIIMAYIKNDITILKRVKESLLECKEREIRLLKELILSLEKSMLK